MGKTQMCPHHIIFFGVPHYIILFSTLLYVHSIYERIGCEYIVWRILYSVDSMSYMVWTTVISMSTWLYLRLLWWMISKMYSIIWLIKLCLSMTNGWLILEFWSNSSKSLHNSRVTCRILFYENRIYYLSFRILFRVKNSVFQEQIPFQNSVCMIFIN